MSLPNDVDSIQRFCCIVDYLAHFLPRISQVTEPLRKLTVKGETWEWRDEHAKAFQKAKNLVAKAPVLAYYDVQKPLVVQYDASERGLGAALLQDDQPVVLASRALAPTEV